MSDDLPPLPEPAHESAQNFGQPYAPFFTADQMRAYAAAAVPLTDERITELWSWSATLDAEHTANTQQHAFARAVERAHGIGEKP